MTVCPDSPLSHDVAAVVDPIHLSPEVFATEMVSTYLLLLTLILSSRLQENTGPVCFAQKHARHQVVNFGQMPKPMFGWLLQLHVVTTEMRTALLYPAWI